MRNENLETRVCQVLHILLDRKLIEYRSPSAEDSDTRDYFRIKTNEEHIPDFVICEGEMTELIRMALLNGSSNVKLITKEYIDNIAYWENDVASGYSGSCGWYDTAIQVQLSIDNAFSEKIMNPQLTWSRGIEENPIENYSGTSARPDEEVHELSSPIPELKPEKPYDPFAIYHVNKIRRNENGLVSGFDYSVHSDEYEYNNFVSEWNPTRGTWVCIHHEYNMGDDLTGNVIHEEDFGFAEEEALAKVFRLSPNQASSINPRMSPLELSLLEGRNTGGDN
jgi:hypothetical protein